MTPPPPFFIVGSPRSGTTLLRFMISRHSRIHIPEETGFVPFLRVSECDTLSLKQVDDVLARIAGLNRNWDDMVPDSEAFYHALREPRLANVLDALYRLRAVEDGAVRWGDKTPLYVQYMPYLNRLFPGARFIHIVRDGRDAVLSALERWGKEKPYIDPYYLLRHWVSNVTTGRAAGQDLGESCYLEIHYEDLVTHPEPVIRAVCDFLGERFEPSMLGTAEPGQETRADELVPDGPASPAHVGRWERDMNSFERKLAHRLAGSTLAALGYRVDPQPPFTPVERLRVVYLAGKFAATNSIRTLGYRLGLLTLNRGARKRPK